ncbi:hypothetical protein ADM96_14090 [Burkholderia sp. ST111]|nr:hypothetical protein ADM96_14090 [Burkholderia sp. ST111]
MGETSADGVQAEPALRPLQRMLSRRVARSPLAETWRTRAGAGAALVTAALLLSACATRVPRPAMPHPHRRHKRAPQRTL